MNTNCAFVSCFPKNKKNRIGLSMSGGGSVAFSGCIGLLRAMNILGLTHFFNPDACISCVSGSSWLCCQVAFSSSPLHLLLGEYLPPEKCFLDALNTINKENKYFVGNCVVDSDIVKEMEMLYLENKVPADQLWIQAISNIFLRPYHLENTVVYDSRMPIKSDVRPPFKKINSFRTRPDFPSLIVNSTLIQKEYTQNGIVNVYFTTQQSGLIQSISSNNEEEYPTLGKVLIQTFSFGCKSVKKCTENKYKKVSMPLNSPYFTIGDMTGISSSSYVKDVQKISSVIPSAINLIPTVNMWSSSSLQNSICELGDGGENDSAGVLALASRSVKKVFLFYTRTFNSSPTPYTIPTIQKLFGVYPDDVISNSIQIFPSERYQEIENMLKQSFEKGEPTFAFMQNLQVLPNSLNNVKGGYLMDFAVFVTNTCKNYNTLLPKETADAINTLEFPFFPNYPIAFADGKNVLALSLSQINLLANYVQWCITQEPIKNVMIQMFR